MIVSSVYRVNSDDVEEFYSLSKKWLSGLANLPGWISGNVARSVDEVDTWLINQNWVDAGSCRRGLSSSELRPTAFTLAKWMTSDVSTFETLITANTSGVVEFKSDRAFDADTFSLGNNNLDED
ncbi:MAG: hypothetical protein FJW76_02045 [Actinobacteria bacterium]|nr:hypothetical protein [Actinomycetota bacterium]